jgi:hypothetical protein
MLTLVHHANEPSSASTLPSSIQLRASAIYVGRGSLALPADVRLVAQDDGGRDIIRWGTYIYIYRHIDIQICIVGVRW